MEERIIVKKPPKSTFGAGVLSAIFPGTGLLYCNQVMKGLLYMLIFAGLVTMQGHERVQPFVALILAGFYIFQIIDTVNTAKAINRKALLGKEEEPEEDELSLKVKTGSVFWGIVLIVLGVVLLLANYDVISYHTLFDLWPLVVIVIGLKLIVDYLTKKSRT
jgi:Ca2+/Na+ antiporter